MQRDAIIKKKKKTVFVVTRATGLHRRKIIAMSYGTRSTRLQRDVYEKTKQNRVRRNEGDGIAEMQNNNYVRRNGADKFVKNHVQLNTADVACGDVQATKFGPMM